MPDDPSVRLKPAGNKFVAADLQVQAEAGPVAVETVDAPAVDLPDDRRIQIEPLTSVVEPGTEPESLPVVRTDETPDSGGLFPDRNDEDRFWHLPAYEIDLPDDGRLFDCTADYQGPNASGEQVTRYAGTIQVSYGTVPAYDEESWESKRPHEEATLEAIPIELETADLRLTYVEDGEEATERIQGRIDRENGRIQFEPQGNFLEIAYLNLAKEGTSATLELTGRFEAWLEQSSEDEPVVNPAIMRSVTDLEPMPEIRTPVAVNQRIGEVGPPRTDGGGKNQVTATVTFEPDPVVAEPQFEPVEVTPVPIRNLPELDEEEAAYVRQRPTVEQELTLEIPCRDYPDQYAEIDGDVTTTFGCTPPWDLGEGDGPGERYERLAADWLPDGLAVYTSLAETDRFLLVPYTYVIGRSRGSGLPLVSVVNATDPDDATASSVRVGLTVRPNLTTFERALVEQGLYEHTTLRNGEPSDPVVEFPTAVPAVSTDVDWQGGIATDVRELTNVPGYTLSLTYESLTNARIALEQIRGDRGSSLGGQVTLDAEGQPLGNATIVADVHRTAGPVLTTTYPADGGGVAVTNDCESPVRVEKFLFYTDGQPGYEVVDVEPRTVAAGETVRLADAEPDGDFDAAAPHYGIEEKPDRTLDEDFVEIDRLGAEFSITASMNAERRGIERIEAVVTFPETDHRETRTLEPDGGNFAGVSETVTFTLPITTYLEPDERTAKYRATVVYEDGRSDHVSPWRRIDLAESSRIALDPDTLRLEENP